MTLRTLSRNDPEFQSYLLGTFSKKLRAVPLQTLNPNTQNEQVTFQILEKAEWVEPNPWMKWSEIFKLRSFLFVAFPIFAVLSRNCRESVVMDPMIIFFSVLASLFILVGANLLNDYFDHLRGLDRIHPDLGQKPIQKGWVTAQSTWNWALLYLALGIVFGGPALFVRPQLMMMVVLPAALALLAWLTRMHGNRFLWGAEFLIFLLAGPLLTVGFHWAVAGSISSEIIAMGILTGWYAVFFVHLKNLETLVVNTKVGFQNTVVQLGFDRSKKLVALWWLAFLLMLSFFQGFYISKTGSLVILGLGLLISIPVLRILGRMSSPVGSDLKRLISVARSTAVGVLGLWVLQNLWDLVVLFGSSVAS